MSQSKLVAKASNTVEFGSEQWQKKAMISQPMRNKSEEEIAQARALAVSTLESKGLQVVNTWFRDYSYGSEQLKERGVTNIPLCFLARALDTMSKCDAVYFAADWETARGQGCCGPL